MSTLKEAEELYIRKINALDQILKIAEKFDGKSFGKKFASAIKNETDGKILFVDDRRNSPSAYFRFNDDGTYGAAMFDYIEDWNVIWSLPYLNPIIGYQRVVDKKRHLVFSKFALLADKLKSKYSETAKRLSLESEREEEIVAEYKALSERIEKLNNELTEEFKMRHRNDMPQFIKVVDIPF